MNFFVAALPRSRTAWLSVFLSQGRPCLHDGFNGCESLSEYADKLGENGDSSTGLTMIDVNTYFPDSKVVIIDKNDTEFNKCVRWCDVTFKTNSRHELTRQRQVLKKMKGLHVNQSDIDDRLEEIFTYLTGCEWDSSYTELSKFNIQVDPYRVDYVAADKLITEINNGFH